MINKRAIIDMMLKLQKGKKIWTIKRDMNKGKRERQIKRKRNTKNKEKNKE